MLGHATEIRAKFCRPYVAITLDKLGHKDVIEEYPNYLLLCNQSIEADQITIEEFN